MTHIYDLFKVWIIHKVSKIRHNIKIFALSRKMLNLSKRELRLIAKKEVLAIMKICQKMN